MLSFGPPERLAKKKVTVVGSTGPTGQELVRRAILAGHEVTAVARRPEAVEYSHPHLRTAEADVLDPEWSGEELAGSDAVLSAIGSRQMAKPTHVYSQGTASIIGAMQRTGVKRLIGITALPLEPDCYKSGLERQVVHPLLETFYGGGYQDMRRMEEELERSPIEWTVFRPPRLRNRRPKGNYRTAVGERLPAAWSLPRADLADAMLAAIDDERLVRQAVAIAT